MKQKGAKEGKNSSSPKLQTAGHLMSSRGLTQFSARGMDFLMYLFRKMAITPFISVEQFEFGNIKSLPSCQ